MCPISAQISSGQGIDQWPQQPALPHSITNWLVLAPLSRGRRLSSCSLDIFWEMRELQTFASLQSSQTSSELHHQPGLAWLPGCWLGIKNSWQRLLVPVVMQWRAVTTRGRGTWCDPPVGSPGRGWGLLPVSLHLSILTDIIQVCVCQVFWTLTCSWCFWFLCHQDQDLTGVIYLNIIFCNHQTLAAGPKNPQRYPTHPHLVFFTLVMSLAYHHHLLFDLNTDLLSIVLAADNVLNYFSSSPSFSGTLCPFFLNCLWQFWGRTVAAGRILGPSKCSQAWLGGS